MRTPVLRTPPLRALVPALLLSASVCLAADAPADPPALRKEGYKVSEVKGEKRYCKKETILGSRLNTRTVCWTADQIKANKEAADILREKQGQRQTF